MAETCRSLLRTKMTFTNPSAFLSPFKTICAKVHLQFYALKQSITL